jgi:hypothetical protein
MDETAPLFDDIVGAAEQQGRGCETKLYGKLTPVQK